MEAQKTVLAIGQSFDNATNKLAIQMSLSQKASNVQYDAVDNYPPKEIKEYLEKTTPNLIVLEIAAISNVLEIIDIMNSLKEKVLILIGPIYTNRGNVTKMLETYIASENLDESSSKKILDFMNQENVICLNVDNYTSFSERILELLDMSKKKLPSIKGLNDTDASKVVAHGLRKIKNQKSRMSIREKSITVKKLIQEVLSLTSLGLEHIRMYRELEETLTHLGKQ